MSFSIRHFPEAFGLSLDPLLVFTEMTECISMLSKAISWEVLQSFSWETGFIIHAHIVVRFVSPLWGSLAICAFLKVVFSNHGAKFSSHKLPAFG